MEPTSDTLLLEFIRYNNWANAQVFAACQNLTPQQLSASAPGTYGSIHATLGHIIAAEADYINRMTGSGPQPPFRWQDRPALEDIFAFSSEVAEAWFDVIQSVPLNQIVHEEEDGNTIDYKASLLFLQVVNHGIEHRTNITTILNGLGLPTPEIDGWGYLFGHPDRFALKETFKENLDADHKP
jgi:uncharacterized damage-inducible protein DinB